MTPIIAEIENIFMKTYSYSIIFISILFIAGCTNIKKSENKPEFPISKEIIVYGSRDCDHCLKFLSQLDSISINYQFQEVDKDEEQFAEMYQKIQKINYKGYVSFPVVDIEGQIFVNPGFNQVIQIITD